MSCHLQEKKQLSSTWCLQSCGFHSSPKYSCPLPPSAPLKKKQQQKTRKYNKNIPHYVTKMCGAAVALTKVHEVGKPTWHRPRWRVSGAQLSSFHTHFQSFTPLSPRFSPRRMCWVRSILQLSMCVLVTTRKWCAAPGLTSRKHSSSWSYGRKRWQ